jgi:hypothetical protein
MMAAVNEHTGDLMRSKAASNNYRNNYDAIFGKKPAEEKVPQPAEVEEKK